MMTYDWDMKRTVSLLCHVFGILTVCFAATSVTSDSTIHASFQSPSTVITMSPVSSTSYSTSPSSFQQTIIVESTQKQFVSPTTSVIATTSVNEQTSLKSESMNISPSLTSVAPTGAYVKQLTTNSVILLESSFGSNLPSVSSNVQTEQLSRPGTFISSSFQTHTTSLVVPTTTIDSAGSIATSIQISAVSSTSLQTEIVSTKVVDTSTLGSSYTTTSLSAFLGLSTIDVLSTQQSHSTVSIVYSSSVISIPASTIKTVTTNDIDTSTLGSSYTTTSLPVFLGLSTIEVLSTQQSHSTVSKVYTSSVISIPASTIKTVTISSANGIHALLESSVLSGTTSLQETLMSNMQSSSNIYTTASDISPTNSIVQTMRVGSDTGQDISEMIPNSPFTPTRTSLEMHSTETRISTSPQTTSTSIPIIIQDIASKSVELLYSTIPATLSFVSALESVSASFSTTGGIISGKFSTEHSTDSSMLHVSKVYSLTPVLNSVSSLITGQGTNTSDVVSSLLTVASTRSKAYVSESTMNLETPLTLKVTRPFFSQSSSNLHMESSEGTESYFSLATKNNQLETLSSRVFQTSGSVLSNAKMHVSNTDLHSTESSFNTLALFSDHSTVIPHSTFTPSFTMFAMSSIETKTYESEPSISLILATSDFLISGTESRKTDVYVTDNISLNTTAGYVSMQTSTSSPTLSAYVIESPISRTLSISDVSIHASTPTVKTSTYVAEGLATRMLSISDVSMHASSPNVKTHTYVTDSLVTRSLFTSYVSIRGTSSSPRVKTSVHILLPESLTTSNVLSLSMPTAIHETNSFVSNSPSESYNVGSDYVSRIIASSSLDTETIIRITSLYTVIQPTTSSSFYQRVEATSSLSVHRSLSSESVPSDILMTETVITTSPMQTTSDSYISSLAGSNTSMSYIMSYAGTVISSGYEATHLTSGTDGSTLTHNEISVTTTMKPMGESITPSLNSDQTKRMAIVTTPIETFHTSSTSDGYIPDGYIPSSSYVSGLIGPMQTLTTHSTHVINNSMSSFHISTTMSIPTVTTSSDAPSILHLPHSSLPVSSSLAVLSEMSTIESEGFISNSISPGISLVPTSMETLLSGTVDTALYSRSVLSSISDTDGIVSKTSEGFVSESNMPGSITSVSRVQSSMETLDYSSIDPSLSSQSIVSLSLTTKTIINLGVSSVLITPTSTAEQSNGLSDAMTRLATSSVSITGSLLSGFSTDTNILSQINESYTASATFTVGYTKSFVHGITVTESEWHPFQSSSPYVTLVSVKSAIVTQSDIIKSPNMTTELDTPAPSQSVYHASHFKQQTTSHIASSIIVTDIGFATDIDSSTKGMSTIDSFSTSHPNSSIYTSDVTEKITPSKISLHGISSNTNVTVPSDQMSLIASTGSLADGKGTLTLITTSSVLSTTNNVLQMSSSTPSVKSTSVFNSFGYSTGHLETTEKLTSSISDLQLTPTPSYIGVHSLESGNMSLSYFTEPLTFSSDTFTIVDTPIPSISLVTSSLQGKLLTSSEMRTDNVSSFTDIMSSNSLLTSMINSSAHLTIFTNTSEAYLTSSRVISTFYASQLASTGNVAHSTSDRPISEYEVLSATELLTPFNTITVSHSSLLDTFTTSSLSELSIVPSDTVTSVLIPSVSQTSDISTAPTIETGVMTSILTISTHFQTVTLVVESSVVSRFTSTFLTANSPAMTGSATSQTRTVVDTASSLVLLTSHASIDTTLSASDIGITETTTATLTSIENFTSMLSSKESITSFGTFSLATYSTVSALTTQPSDIFTVTIDESHISSWTFNLSAATPDKETTSLVSSSLSNDILTSIMSSFTPEFRISQDESTAATISPTINSVSKISSSTALNVLSTDVLLSSETAYIESSRSLPSFTEDLMSVSMISTPLSSSDTTLIVDSVLSTFVLIETVLTRSSPAVESIITTTSLVVESTLSSYTMVPISPTPASTSIFSDITEGLTTTAEVNVTSVTLVDTFISIESAHVSDWNLTESTTFIISSSLALDTNTLNVVSTYSSSLISTSSVIYTTTELPKTTTVNATNANEVQWVRTVLKVQRSVNISAPSFIKNTENGLASAFNEAFIRKKLIEEGKFEPLRRRRKRFTTVGDVSVHIHDLSRVEDTSTVLAIYAVEKSGKLLTSEDAVAALGVLNQQELAIILKQVIVVNAEAYIQTEDPPASPTSGSQLWLYGVIAGSAAGAIILVWIVVCVYCKCCRHKSTDEECEPELTSIHPQSSKRKKSQTRPLPFSPVKKALVTQNSRFSLKKGRPYELNNRDVPESLAEEQQLLKSPTRKKGRQSPVSSLNGSSAGTPVLPKRELVPPTVRNGRRNSKNSIGPALDGVDLSGGSFKLKSSKVGRGQLFHSSVSEDSEEAKEHLKMDKRKNKERLREKYAHELDANFGMQDKGKANDSKASILGMPSTAVPSFVIHSGSPTKEALLSSRRHSEGDSTGEENLQEARSRMHKLLDDAFSLISPRNSITENDLRKTIETISSKSLSDKVDKDTHASNSNLLDMDKVRDSLKGYTNPAYTSSYSEFLETWSPYRAFDQVALISMPHKPEPAVTRLGNRSDRRPATSRTAAYRRPAANLDLTNYKSTSNMDETTAYTTSPPKPIVLRTKDDSRNGRLDSARSNIANNEIQANRKFSIVGLNGNIVLTGSSNALSTAAPKSKPENTDSLEMKQVRRKRINSIRKHREPEKNIRNRDEIDIIQNIKPEEATDNLIKSLRDEIKNIKVETEEDINKKPIKRRNRKHMSKPMTDIM